MKLGGSSLRVGERIGPHFLQHLAHALDAFVALEDEIRTTVHAQCLDEVMEFPAVLADFRARAPLALSIDL